MRVLGCDPSTKTGLAIVEFIRSQEPKLEYLSEMKFTKLKGVEREAAFYKNFFVFLSEYQPDFVVFEGYGFSSNTLAISVGIGTALRLATHLSDLKFLEVAPNGLKKFITGKGAGKKDVIMKEAYKRWGIEGTDNEVDAYSLAMFGGAAAGLYTGMPKLNMDAVTKVLDSNPNFF